ncbi:hypothetical protein [Frigoriglobus tundricola]|uniref:Uncharacterized protein n=1 Tax=Frigoriglobus tundricola TaxID=2774151 RepID=A0A6M5YRQ5_9BACT|nr:hypothetical protein [Frigoriglobus tundricola]QJW95652.1 hypothetical protein FTUN_3206 [Frigoriglobus tundricola]
MKVLAWFVAASALLVAGSTHAQDKKSDPKLTVENLEQGFGLKMKSVAYNAPKPPPKTRTLVSGDKPADKTDIVITFEFTKGVTDVRQLLWLHESFAPSAGVPFAFNQLPLIFHFFDEDNVCIEKAVISSIEGDLSGIKGEAFRIILSGPTEVFKRAKRIEARYYLPPPKLDP